MVEQSPGTSYVKSLRDAVKRRYANEYLTWIQAGRSGSAPPRQALPLGQWKVITANLDALT